MSEDYIIDEACIKENFLGAFSQAGYETGLSEEGVRTALFKSDKKQDKYLNIHVLRELSKQDYVYIFAHINI